MDPGRVDDLIAIIEGPNTPQARQTAAREFLRLGWSETPVRFAGILSGPSREAKLAVAVVLGESPQHLTPSYVEPLIGMLADPDAEVRRAAGTTLTAYRDSGVLPRLRQMALDLSLALPLRLAAIETLGLTTRRDAIAALMECLDDPTAAVGEAALNAIENATGLPLGGRPDAARQWWEQTRDLPLGDWHQYQIERLVRQQRASAERVRTMVIRLQRALRDAHLRTPEPDRPAALRGYLSEPSADVRSVGLELVRAQLAEGKTPAPETIVLVRSLLRDGNAGVRQAAVYTVASFRDAADGQRFIELLAMETDAEVRRALANGLGYVGDATAAETLLNLMPSSDETLVAEAVTALGRLAERGTLDDVLRQTVTAALLERLQATIAPSSLREPLLAALGRIADPRCRAVFAEALAPSEDAAVRRTAARGLAAVGDAASMEALLGAFADADASVRKTAVEAVGAVATSDAHLEALWGRLAPEHEPDESIREAAWRGAASVLSHRPVSTIETWIERMPSSDPKRTDHTIELLQSAESALGQAPETGGQLGLLRARLAAEHARAGRPDVAVQVYLAALNDLHATQSDDIPRVAIELLRVALPNGLYDERLASALANGNPSLDPTTVWQEIRDEIEKCVNPQDADRAIAMLSALQAHPPTTLPADISLELEQLLQRAQALQEQPPDTPASEPAAAPTTQPTSDATAALP